MSKKNKKKNSKNQPNADSKENNFSSVENFNVNEFQSLVIDLDKKDIRRITDNDLKDADLESIKKHNTFYSKYLKTFVDAYEEKTEKQKEMKDKFFKNIMALLFIVICGGAISLIIISAKANTKASDVAIVVTAMAGIVSSFLALPKVIAENLFPSKEEDKAAELFGKMFNHDISIRNIYNVPRHPKNADEKKEK